MGPLEPIGFSGSVQTIQSVLSNRFEHPEATLARPFLLAQQALVDQGRYSVDHIETRIRPSASEHGFDGGHRAAAAEHREAAKQQLLVRRQRVVAPGDRLAKCLLA